MEENIDSLSEGLKQQVDTGLAPKTVKPGDEVEILTIGSRGTVLSAPDGKGEVQLQAGIMKFKAHLSQLRLVKEPESKKKQASVTSKTGAMTRTVPMSCDVRGKTLDEALYNAEQSISI